MKPPILGLEWDDGNFAKCQKHGVSPEEIEDVLTSGRMMRFPDPNPEEPRLRGIGITQAGRHIFIVYTLRSTPGGMRIRPISARYMHRKEVDHYEQQQATAAKLSKR
jgi:uncharacterized DUF497 family protein